MAPTPRPAPKRRSGLADEPIESGEIVPIEERRSLIIRSQPRVDVVPDPRLVHVPEHSAPQIQPQPHLPTKPEPGRLKFLWLAGAIVVAAVGLALPSMIKPEVVVTTDALQPAAAMIGAALDGEARAVQSRADALATTPVLRDGLATDPQTLADMAKDKDLVLPVKGAEVVEVFRITDDARQSMLRIPASGRALEPPPAGKSKLEVHLEHGLSVVATAKITADVPGEIALSAPIDLEPIRQRLAGQVHEALIVGLAIPIVLVKSSGDVGRPVTVPIKSTVNNAISLSAIVNVESKLPQTITITRYASFGLAGLLLVAFLVALLRR